MIDPKQLLTTLQKRVMLLEDDLRAKEADRIMAGQNHKRHKRHSLQNMILSGHDSVIQPVTT